MKIIQLVKKEYILFKRNKKLLWTTVALPIIFSFIYLLMFSFSDVEMTIALCNLDNGKYSQELGDAISSNFNTIMLEGGTGQECKEELKLMLKDKGTIGLIIPQGFSDSIAQYNTPTIYIFYDNSKPNLGFFARTYLINKIDEFKREVIHDSETTIKSSTSEIESELKGTLNTLEVMNNSIPSVVRKSYTEMYNRIVEYKQMIEDINRIDINFLVNPVDIDLVGMYDVKNSEGFSYSVLYLVLNVIIILLIGGVNTIEDKRDGLLLRLRTSTTPFAYYLISKLIFFSAVGMAILLPSFLVFYAKGAYFNMNPITTIVAVAIVSSISALMAMAIGLISKEESGTIMVSIFLGFIFLLLSGLFYPIDLLPNSIRVITEILPIKIGTELINGGLLLDEGLRSMTNTIKFSLGYIATLSIINYMLFKREVK